MLKETKKNVQSRLELCRLKSLKCLLADALHKKACWLVEFSSISKNRVWSSFDPITLSSKATGNLSYFFFATFYHLISLCHSISSLVLQSLKGFSSTSWTHISIFPPGNKWTSFGETSSLFPPLLPLINIPLALVDILESESSLLIFTGSQKNAQGNLKTEQMLNMWRFLRGTKPWRHLKSPCKWRLTLFHPQGDLFPLLLGRRQAQFTKAQLTQQKG